MTRPQVSVLFLSLGIAVTPVVYAIAKDGGSGSHGGGFVVCRLPGKNRMSIELADVYEGRTQRGYTYHRMDLAYAEGISKTDFRKGLSRTARSAVEEKLEWIDRQLEDPHAQVEQILLPQDDVKDELLHALHLPPECTFFQAAKFFDRPDSIVWSWRALEEAFGPNWRAEWPAIELKNADGTSFFTNLPGDRGPADVFVFQLKVHEAIYRLARERCGDVNSKRTRKIVGLLFSDAAVEKDFWHSDVDLSELNLPQTPRFGWHIQIEHSYRIKHRAAKRELRRLVDDLLAGRPYREE